MTRDSLHETLNAWGAQGIPIDDERRDRMRGSTVEHIRETMHRTAEQRRRRSWTTGALLAALVGAGAAVAVVGLSALLERSAAEPVAASSSQSQLMATAAGSGAAARRGSELLPLAEEAFPLLAGDELYAGAAAKLRLALPETGHATLATAGELLIGETSRQTQHFELRRGALSVAIPPEAPPRHLSVKTAHATVSVVGTEFSVRVFDAGDLLATEVHVQRGRVHVREAGGREHWLTAGDSWHSRTQAGSAAEAAPETPRDASGGEAGAKPQPRPPATSTLAEQNRLYLTALEARDAGDDARTVSLLNTFVARYPSSPLRQEAEVERFRALKRLGQSKDATRAARRYLAEYGSGFARDEAQALALPSAQPEETQSP